MVNYQNTVMYAITCEADPDFLYIGHTVDFDRRFREHRNDSKKCQSYVYRRIRELGGWDTAEVKVDVFEEFPCDTLRDADNREQYWIDTLDATMNTNRAHNTNDDHKANDARWYNDNKNRILKKAKERYETNKEKIKANVKERTLKNKDAIREYQKEYRLNNNKKGQKYTCECGCEVSVSSLYLHIRSKKHLKLLEAMEN